MKKLSLIIIFAIIIVIGMGIILKPNTNSDNNDTQNTNTKQSDIKTNDSNESDNQENNTNTNDSNTNDSNTDDSKSSEDRSTTETKFSSSIDAALMDTFLDGKDVGLSYYNFDNGDTYTNNSTTEYTAASTVKVGIAMKIADMIANDELTLDTVETYTQDDYEGGSGSLQNDPVGSKYTIEELMTRMITESDNIATQILIRVITRPVYNEVMNEYTNSTFNMADNLLSADQGMALLRHLYENPDNTPGYDQIIDLMKQTVYNDRLSTYIDDDHIAHKIGDFGSIGIANDLGLIYGDNTVAVSFYCQDGQKICYEYAAEIGKYVYELNTKAQTYDTPSKVETNEEISYATLDE